MNLLLKRSLTHDPKIRNLIDDILVCNSIIKRAGEPSLIDLFKARRDKATEQLNKLSYGG